jgi:ribosomal protein S18 acetylase RimI-like enzyme
VTEPDVHVDSARMEEADAITAAWIDLAAGQRRFGSYLLADENRTAVRETISRAIVTGGLLVVRASGLRDGPSGSGEAGDDGIEDGDIAGFVMFSHETGNYEQSAEKGVIENIYVHPSWRDEGIGSALLSAAEGALRDGGAEVIILDVMAENEDARRFYEDHGYRPHRVTMAKEDENDIRARRQN